MRFLILLLCVLAGFDLAAANAAELSDVKAGMSPQAVIDILGTPDRIAVMDGKYLRDVPLESAAASGTEGRFVFIYRERNANVWFARGLAAGLQKGGAPVSNLTGTADH